MMVSRQDTATNLVVQAPITFYQLSSQLHRQITLVTEVHIAGLEQERTSCSLEETEKIEKQALHNANKSTI